ncbi:MAG: hypothetical protein ACUVV0_02060 [Anaerolineae bacterium]
MPPNLFSLPTLENLASWSFIGNYAQNGYIIAQALIGRKFHLGKHLTKVVGDVMRSWGIAIAVVFLLRVIKLSIGNLELTLENTTIEVIIALSFILGFYNEDARFSGRNEQEGQESPENGAGKRNSAGIRRVMNEMKGRIRNVKKYRSYGSHRPVYRRHAGGNR